MTATWQTREQLIHELVTLHRQGSSRRAIARALGISRNTVKVLVAAHATARDEGQPVIAKRGRRGPPRSTPMRHASSRSSSNTLTSPPSASSRRCARRASPVATPP
jgi:hypothetical protein